MYSTTRDGFLSRPKLEQRVASERGVSILEFAIILPILVLLIAGVIDLGYKLNSVNSVSEAAKYASRVAAAHSRKLADDTLCGPAISASVCPAGSGSIAIDTTEANPVSNVARQSACAYLDSTGLNAENWRVSSRIVESTEEGSTFQVAEVYIERADKDCLLCYENYFEGFRTKNSARFILEGRCA